MKVFKFGGASVKNAGGIINMAHILERYRDEDLVIVLSAMGKTTNSLEALANAFYHELADKMDVFREIRNYHLETCQELFGDKSPNAIAETEKILRHLEGIIDPPEEGLSLTGLLYDYVYDLIVSTGELLSTQIVSAWLNIKGYSNILLDARELILADHTYREGKVLWDLSADRVKSSIPEILANGTWVITQGFIAGTTDHKPVTLGREGSDYTAAILSNILDAEACVIWKDVPGLMNADPRMVPDAVKIDRISYGEAIELAYYGARVIHHKTLKPLQNKSIPLLVKSFNNPDESGTIISEDQVEVEISSIIFKENQVLISITPKDYSFIAEENLYVIFGILARYHIRVNVMQHSAISFSICIDDQEKLPQLTGALQDGFNVKFNTGLQLITIRHYTAEMIANTAGNKTIYLEQRSRNTVQLVVKA